MSKITTEDCKNFIKEHFSLTSTVNIKRDRKYKDGNGDVIRVFLINGADTCLIKEDSQGDLSIISEGEVVDKPAKTAVSKDFNAKQFLKKHIKKLESDDDYDAMEKFCDATQALSAEDKVKVANEFCFFFPSETYENELKYVVNGLDTPMIRFDKHGGACFCIVFYDSLNSEPDLYVSDILRAILPDYFDKVDEYHFEMDTTELTKTITIRDMISLLEHLGFKYKNNPDLDDEECMLVKLNLK